MIKSWGDSATRRFAEGGKCKFSGLDEEAAMDLLAVVDSATSLRDISPLKSAGLHKLKGDRKGQWARGNGRLRSMGHRASAFGLPMAMPGRCKSWIITEGVKKSCYLFTRVGF